MSHKIALALILVIGFTAYCRAPGDPTKPTPRIGAFTQHAADLASARATRPRVVFLGDSITNRWRSSGLAAWQRSITPLGAANLGVGEDRVEHLLWRLRSGEFHGICPQVVVILIGTNNVARDRAPDIAAGIEVVTTECRAIWPRAQITLMGLFPRGDRGARRFNRDIAKINARLSVQSDPWVRFVDIAPLLIDAQGYLRPDLAPDGVHLSAAGYEVWANALVSLK